jgi:hypothetical protein
MYADGASRIRRWGLTRSGPRARSRSSPRPSTTPKASKWIGALYIYTYEDSGSDATTDEDWFGLLSADGSPKPAWSAVAAAIA